MKKRLLGMLSFCILACLLVACGPKQEPQANAEPVYVILEGNLLGYYEDSAWHSFVGDPEKESANQKAQSMPLSSLFSVPQYYLYDMEKQIAVSNRLIWHPELYTDDQWLDKDGNSIFAPYYMEGKDQEYGNALLYFNLPFKEMSQDILEKEVPLDHFYMHFYVDDREMSPIMATNMSQNPLPKQMIIKEDFSTEEEEIVRTFLDANGLTGSVAHILSVVVIDLDDDGIEEKIILANTPNGEDGYPLIAVEDITKEDTGTYCTALLVKGEQVIPLYHKQYFLRDLFEHYRDGKSLEEFTKDWVFLGIESCTNIRFLGCYDFDQDGTYEIALRNITWDIPEIRLYDWQENTMQQVLYGNFAW